MLKWVLGAGVVMALAAGAAYGVIPGLDGLFGAPQAEAGEAPVVKPPSTANPLAAKQKELIERETALSQREAQVNEREQQVATLSVVLAAERNELDTLRQVTDLYAAMPPFKAGPLLASLDSAQAVELLRRLDQDQAAAILAYMDKQAAARLTAELMKPASTKTSP